MEFACKYCETHRVFALNFRIMPLMCTDSYTSYCRLSNSKIPTLLIFDIYACFESDLSIERRIHFYVVPRLLPKISSPAICFIALIRWYCPAVFPAPHGTHALHYTNPCTERFIDYILILPTWGFPLVLWPKKLTNLFPNFKIRVSYRQRNHEQSLINISIFS